MTISQIQTQGVDEVCLPDTEEIISVPDQCPISQPGEAYEPSYYQQICEFSPSPGNLVYFQDLEKDDFPIATVENFHEHFLGLVADCGIQDIKILMQKMENAAQFSPRCMEWDDVINRFGEYYELKNPKSLTIPNLAKVDILKEEIEGGGAVFTLLTYAHNSDFTQKQILKTRVYVTDQGISYLQETKDAYRKAHIRYVDALGFVQEAGFELAFGCSLDSLRDLGGVEQFENMVQYFDILSRAELEGGNWDLKHQALLTAVPARVFVEQAEDMFEAIPVKGQGFVPMDTSHGGVLLEVLLSSTEGLNLDQKIKLPLMKDGRRTKKHVTLTPREMLEAYKHCFDISSEWRLPELHCEEGHYVDAYSYLITLLHAVPVEEWSKEWTTERGEKLSIHKVMEVMEERYKNWDGRTGGMVSHDYYHLPALLLLYYTKQERDPQEIPESFRTRELRNWHFIDDPSNFSAYSDVAHYTQSLGTLMDSPSVTWEKEEKYAPWAWVLNSAKFYLWDQEMSWGSEMAHFAYGLQMIRANKDKVEY